MQPFGDIQTDLTFWIILVGEGFLLFCFVLFKTQVKSDTFVWSALGLILFDIIRQHSATLYSTTPVPYKN